MSVAEVVAEVKLSKALPDKYRLDVSAKLYRLDGNERPYFSVTADLLNMRYSGDRRYEAGGCLHEDVLAHFPELAPVVALHLADDRGVPMHASANGHYFLGLGKYKEHNGKPLPSYEIFASQWRITEHEAREARDFALSYEGGTQEAMDLLTYVMLDRWQMDADEGVAIIRKLAGEEIRPTMGGSCRYVYAGRDELLYFRCTTHSTEDREVISIGTDVWCELA